ncbi:MAG TPA: Uma2 family endonuclease [Chthonomonadaceae bacterium]|nr:Uma2 family endonuclease [Chthonomonadaceae bacterium]
MTSFALQSLPLALPYRRMTYQEFLDWADEDVHAEWVDGAVEYTHLSIDPDTQELTMSVSRTHTKIGKFLIRLLESWIEDTQAGELQYAPFQMKTGPDLPGREPDVFFVATEHLDRLREKYLDGPADAVFEIVSADSVTRDHLWKRSEYESGGVREYWIIDPLKKEALLYSLGADGRYARIDLESDGRLHSRVMPGVAFSPEWFWRPRPPAASEVLPSWTVAP